MLTALLAVIVPKAVDIEIDARQSSPISPYIYGVNSDDFEHLGPNVTLSRIGGNRMTAYNWENNASNAGNDYHFQNDDFMARDLPASEKSTPGAVIKSFLVKAQGAGAACILTVPTAGFVSADTKGDGDVRQSPNSLSTRFVKSYAHKPGAHFGYPPNLTDRAVYQDEFVSWIEHIKQPTPPVWYMLDNEPDLWGSTHNEIWPKNPTYAQIISNNIEYARAIKSVAPATMVFGPANYGWGGFTTFQGASDANSRDFLNTYLDAMKDAGKAEGHRLLDSLDIHFYPEARGDNVRVTDESPKPGVAAARIQAPRSLWDPNYVETSWIADSLGHKPIRLIPRIQQQIAEHYPGTKFSISEYNYGGANDISGAIAQADVLGIYGRYGLFAACNWGLSAGDKAELAGFKAFQDYDRRGSKFGDLGLAVKGGSPEDTSIYAALDSRVGGRMTIVAINKTFTNSALDLHLAGFHVQNDSRIYFVTKSNFASGPTVGTAGVWNNTVHLVAPPMSVVTVEVLGHRD